MAVTHSLFAALILLATLFLPAADGFAQSSTCADCHFANPAAPAREHLSDWERSAHGRNNVGCEKCHDGDASTYEVMLAHRGLLGSSNPASPVHRRNLPATCGRCHTGPFVRFQNSQHFKLLGAGDHRVPTCTTSPCGRPERPSPERSKPRASSVADRTRRRRVSSARSCAHAAPGSARLPRAAPRRPGHSSTASAARRVQTQLREVHVRPRCR
jgi:hypothetical protein